MWIKGNHHSEQTRKKMSEVHLGKSGGMKGKHHTKEAKRKMSETLKGHSGWNKGISCSPETKKKMSDVHKGKKPYQMTEKIKQNMRHPKSEEHRRKISESKSGDKNPNYGKHPTEQIRKKMAESRKGDKSHLWKGGITPENKKIRQGIELRLWREAVFARDNWTCQKCKTRSGNGKTIYLHSHHIKSFAHYPELRFAIDNGIAVCKDCHKLIHKKG